MDKITGRQLAAARTLTGLTQAEVAARSNLSVPTLKRMEASEGQVAGMQNNVDAVIRALEAAGVTFLAAGETTDGGPGVRLRKIEIDPSKLKIGGITTSKHVGLPIRASDLVSGEVHAYVVNPDE